MLNKLELVKIEWDDASALEHGWTDPADETLSAQMVTTVGFMVAEDEKYVVVAHTTDGSYVNGRFQIPKGMIKSITPLQKKRKKTGGIAPPVVTAIRTDLAEASHS